MVGLKSTERKRFLARFHSTIKVSGWRDKGCCTGSSSKWQLTSNVPRSSAAFWQLHCYMFGHRMGYFSLRNSPTHSHCLILESRSCQPRKFPRDYLRREIYTEYQSTTDTSRSILLPVIDYSRGRRCNTASHKPNQKCVSESSNNNWYPLTFCRSAVDTQQKHSLFLIIAPFLPSPLVAGVPLCLKNTRRVCVHICACYVGGSHLALILHITV